MIERIMVGVMDNTIMALMVLRTDIDQTIVMIPWLPITVAQVIITVIATTTIIIMATTIVIAMMTVNTTMNVQTQSHVYPYSVPPIKVTIGIITKKGANIQMRKEENGKREAEAGVAIAMELVHRFQIHQIKFDSVEQLPIMVVDCTMV